MNDDTQPQRPVPPGEQPASGPAGPAGPEPTVSLPAAAGDPSADGRPAVAARSGRLHQLRGWRGAAVVGAAAVILGSAGGVAIAQAGGDTADEGARGGYGAPGYGPAGRPGTDPRTGEEGAGPCDGDGAHGPRGHGPRGERDGDGPPAPPEGAPTPPEGAPDAAPTPPGGGTEGSSDPTT
ncbi:hypothetical protein [Nocardioides aurantiacus]|uniref:hypothetical protein n=1 Tax=Nocardioides aurantiacus TaxID=86796 RepID=UPI00403F2E0E